MTLAKRQQLTEHKRQRTTRQQDLDRERARELKREAPVSAFEQFLADWKRTTLRAMTGGQ